MSFLQRLFDRQGRGTADQVYSDHPTVADGVMPDVGVQGPAAVGQPGVGNPVLLGFLDGDGNVLPWPNLEGYLPMVGIVGDVRITPSPGNLTSRGGTITAGGVAQSLMDANANRSVLIFQNVSDTAMWIRFSGTAAATQPSLLMPANMAAPFTLVGVGCPRNDISIFCITTGKAFSAYEG
jgi:hypothetical protein